MERRDFFKGLLAAPVDVCRRGRRLPRTASKGLPPLTIKDVKVITTSGGRNYRWVFLKIITSEPGLYGIGSANDNYQTHGRGRRAGKAPEALADRQGPGPHRGPLAERELQTYWRGGPVNNKVLGAMDEALWDIKGKRAGMPVYEMLGGTAHDAVACYDHVSGRTKEQAAEAVAKSMESRLPPHPPAVRRGRLRRRRLHPRQRGQSRRRRLPGPGVRRGPVRRDHPAGLRVRPLQSGIRAQAAARCPLAPDRRPTRFCSAKKMEPYHMYFVEDLLGPEHLDWYREVRKVCATPQAVGEVFSNPAEYYPLIAARMIDFIRTPRHRHRRHHAGEEDRQPVRGLRRQDRLPGGRRERPCQSARRLSCGYFELRVRHSGGEPLPAAGARDDARHRRNPQGLHVRQRPSRAGNRHQRRDGRQIPDHRRPQRRRLWDRPHSGRNGSHSLTDRSEVATDTNVGEYNYIFFLNLDGR